MNNLNDLDTVDWEKSSKVMIKKWDLSRICKPAINKAKTNLLVTLQTRKIVSKQFTYQKISSLRVAVHWKNKATYKYLAEDKWTKKL